MLATFIWKTLGRCCSSSGGAPSLVPGLFVVPAGLVPLLDPRLDDPLADGHLHPVDGGPGGGRKDVDRLEGLFPFILVELGDQDIGDHAGDPDRGGGGLQGEPVHGGIIAFHKK